MRYLLLIFLFLYSLAAYSADEKMLVVFPILAPDIAEKVKNDSWISARSRIKKSSKFLVATYSFMKSKKVLQPRGELVVSDVLILGRLLESDYLMTLFVQRNNLKIRAYNSKDGQVVFKKSILFNIGMPFGEQLNSASLRLVKDFLKKPLVTSPNEQHKN